MTTPDLTVTNNQFKDNSESGIYVYDSPGGSLTIERNDLRRIGDFGTYLWLVTPRPDQVSVGGNDVSDSWAGITLNSSSDLSFDGAVPFDLGNGASANNVNGCTTAFRVDSSNNTTTKNYTTALGAPLSNDVPTAGTVAHGTVIDTVDIVGAGHADHDGINLYGDNVTVTKVTVTGSVPV
jgi:parallel beta-helix repeat protein